MADAFETESDAQERLFAAEQLESKMRATTAIVDTGLAAIAFVAGRSPDPWADAAKQSDS